MLTKNGLTESSQHQIGWKAVTASVRGSSHFRSGLPNQDACEVRTWREGRDSSVIVAIADGHGGARHFRSQTGAELAVQAAISALSSTAKSEEPPDAEAIASLTRQIEAEWRAAVRRHFEVHPLTAEDTEKLAQLPDGGSDPQTDASIAYGATLLAALATPWYMLLLQIGDGDILAVQRDGGTARPIASDDRLIGNQTTSLCQPNSWREFRSSVLLPRDGGPALVLLSTDGYANSFRTEEDFLKIGHDYLRLISEKGLESVADELTGILNDASQNGSGDDVTLGLIYNDHAAVRSTPVAAASSPNATAPGVRKQPSPIARNVVVGLLLAVLLAAAGFFTHRRRAAQPVATVTHPTHTTEEPTTGTSSANAPVAPPPAKTPAPNLQRSSRPFTLKVGDRPALTLKAGLSLTPRSLWGDTGPKADQPYAAVRSEESGLVLVNESPDTWTVVDTSGKKRPVGAKESVVLKNGTKLILHSHAAQIRQAKTR